MTAALTSYRPDTMPVGGTILASAGNNGLPPAGSASAKSAPATASSAPTSSGFGFSDVLAILNPLQHIPVVGTLYREWTGDTISPAARIAGDTLYGGVFGLAASVADTLVEGETGKDFGSHIYDTLFGGDTSSSPAATGPAGVTLAPAQAAGATISATPSAGSTPAAPGSFIASLQHGGSHKRAVPLSTSVPLPNVHAGDQALSNAAPSQSEAANAALASAAQQSTNVYGALGSPLPSQTPSQLPSQPATPNSPSSALPTSPVPNPLATTPQADVSNLMLQALDKYNAMARQNGINGSSVSLTN